MNIQQQLDKAQQDNLLLASSVTNIRTWLTEPKYAEYKSEIEALIQKEDWQTLNDNFFAVVPFGTGGRRGTVGVGSNRINNVTIGESAQGLANYINEQQIENPSVAIACDTRNTSPEFSKLTASIMAENGIKVYLFDEFRATPELAFAVRHLNTTAGIVISASHNPPSDNGFKVYWTDGGQIVAPHDKAVMAHVEKTTSIQKGDFNTLKEEGKITIIGQEVDDAYISAVQSESLSSSRSAKITYAPLHGSGVKSVQPTLEKAGFTVSLVQEQATPDGNFPNVPNNNPNPENVPASDMVTAQAIKENADIGITTDPDVDRLGVVARNSNGEYQFLNGNQIAMLIGAYVVETMQSKGTLKKNHFLVRTIVTTDFISALAKKADISIYDEILIGFKYVAELIRTKQDEGNEEFLFGGEESHGILKGSYTRDKDASIAALLLAELTSNLKDNGLTLIDKLDQLYKQYGVFTETLQNVVYPGAQGGEKMKSIMQALRTTPPTSVGEFKVHSITDRASGEEKDPHTNETLSTTSAMKGDVLIIKLHTNKDSITARATIRPSGTEPKLKIYTQVHNANTEEHMTNEALEQIKQETSAIAQSIQESAAQFLQ